MSLGSWLLSLLCASLPLYGQPIQQPFWTLAGPHPQVFENGLTVPAATALPFVAPSTGLNPYADRYRTAANGVYDDCGNPIFYVAGDWVFDATGSEVRYLWFKDRWFKYNDPIYPHDFPFPDPLKTINFEHPICPVVTPAGTPTGDHLIFYTDINHFEASIGFYSDLFMAAYGGPLAPSPPAKAASSIGEFQLRFALSSLDSEFKRTLFACDGRKLTKCIIPPFSPNWGWGEFIEAIEVIPVKTFSLPAAIFSELELSHDGQTLAWATYHAGTSSAKIHLYHLPTDQHTVLEPVQGGLSRVPGLEFLADGRLAAAISWKPPFNQFLDGIGVFNTSYSGYSVIPNSAPFASGMIELGAGTTAPPLFANNGTHIARIGTGANISITHQASVGSTGMTSFFYANTLSVTGALPDQIDGAVYNAPITCGGGSPPTNRTRPEPVAISLLEVPFRTRVE